MQKGMESVVYLFKKELESKAHVHGVDKNKALLLNELKP